MTVVSTPAAQTIWRHYKGGVYLVLGRCVIEGTNTPAVLYQHVDKERWPTVWCRPVLDFNAEVRGRPRFMPLSHAELAELIARADAASEAAR